MDKDIIRAIIVTLGQLDIKPTRENTNRLEAVYQTLEKEMKREEAQDADQDKQGKDV